MGEVRSLHGALTGERVVNEDLVKAIEGLLEAAKSGEIVGAAVARLHYDSGCSWQISGVIGGYGLIGACSLMAQALGEVELSDG